MVVISIVLGALLVGLGRLVAGGAGAFNRFAGRRLPVVLATSATILLLVVVGVAAFRVALALAESNYSSVNDTTDEGVVAPNSPFVSGASESLVPWTDYVAGWAQVVPPEGWTEADTERLEAFLHGGAASED
jgi:uncharacterized membrane protein